jgi:hypothetical protein
MRGDGDGQRLPEVVPEGVGPDHAASPLSWRTHSESVYSLSGALRAREICSWQPASLAYGLVRVRGRAARRSCAHQA